MSDFQPNCTVVDAADYTVRYRGQLDTTLYSPLHYMSVALSFEDAQRVNKSCQEGYDRYLFPIPSHYIIPDASVTEIKVVYHNLQMENIPVENFEWFDEDAWYHRHKMMRQKAARDE
jgi:hypothetical protein